MRRAKLIARKPGRPDRANVNFYEHHGFVVEIEDNYPSKGTGERGAWFRRSRFAVSHHPC